MVCTRYSLGLNHGRLCLKSKPPLTLSATPTMTPMNSAPSSVFSQMIQPRLVLLANHVLSAEPAAMQKLQAHQGKRLELRFQPPAETLLNRWLPKPDPLLLAVTPAGLLELTSESSDMALTVILGVPTLAEAWQMLRQRQRPPLQVEGDAHFAEAVSWIAQNVRWDIAHDLNQWVGLPAAASLGHIRDRLDQTVARWRQSRPS